MKIFRSIIFLTSLFLLSFASKGVDYVTPTLKYVDCNTAYVDDYYFSATCSVPVTRWEWQVGSSGVWQIVNSTAQSYNFTQIVTSNLNVNVRALLTTGSYSNTACYWVQSSGTISFQDGTTNDYEFCPGVAFSVPVIGTDCVNGGLSDYSWECSSDGYNYTAVYSGIITDTKFKSFTFSKSAAAATGTIYLRRTIVDQLCTLYSNVLIFRASSNSYTTGSVSASTGYVCYNTSKTLSYSGQGRLVSSWVWQSSPDNSSWSTITGTSNASSYSTPALTTDMYYRVQTTSSCGTVLSTSSYKVTVTTLTAGTTGSSQTICYNAVPTIIANATSASGGIGTITYQWLSSTDNVNFSAISGATGTTYQPPALTQNYFYERKATNSCGSVYTSPVAITVRTALNGGTIAIGTTNFCYNSTIGAISSQALASGGSGLFTYQWQSSSDNSNWSDIAGETNSNLVVGNRTSSIYYRRKAVDATCGSCYSNTLFINVYNDVTSGSVGAAETICYSTAPSPLTSVTLPTGGNGSFTYQWQSSTDGTNFTDISGATATTYQPTAITVNTYYKRKEMTGCKTVYSNSVLKTVRSDVNAGTIGSDQSICKSSIPNIVSVVTSPSGGTNSFTYQWQGSTDGASFSDIASATAISYQSGALTANKWFRLSVINACATKYTSPVKVTIYADFNKGVIGSAQTICYNSIPSALSFSTSPSGGDGAYTYQWQVSIDGTNFTDVSGQTAASYQPGALTADRWYRVFVSNACGSGYTDPVKITVNADFVVGVLSADQTICYGSTPGIIGFSTTPSGGVGGYSYQWEYSADGAGYTAISGATAVTYQPDALTANRWYRVKVVNSCGTKYTSASKVTVNPSLNAGAIANPQTICYNATSEALGFSTTPSGGVGGYTYQWMVSADQNNFSDVTGATATSYQPAALTANAWYKVKVVNQCETLYTNTIKITVYGDVTNPLIGNSQTICYNGTPEQLSVLVQPAGADGSFNYQWEQSTDGVTFTSISGATGLTYQPVSLTNNRWYRLRAISACKTVYSNTVKVTVYSDVNQGTIGDAQTVCYNTTPNALYFSIAPSGSDYNFAYQWVVSLDGVNYTNIDNATQSTYQPSALTANAWYSVKVKNSCTEKSTNAVKVTVRPDVTPTAITGEQSICYNTIPSAIEVATYPGGSDGNFTYQWEQSIDGSAFTSITGANTVSYQPVNLVASKWYRLKVFNSCKNTYSNTVKVTVYGDVNAGVIGSAQTIYYNATPSQLAFTTNPSGGDNAFTLQWQSSSNGSIFSDIAGASVSTYQPGALIADTWYRVKVVCGCKTLYTDAIKITVNPAVNAGVIGSAQSICYSSTPSALSFSTLPSGADGIFTLQWEQSFDGSSFFAISSAIGDSYQPGSLTSNTWYRVKVVNSADTRYTNVVKITVFGQLSSGSIGSDQTVCSGSTPSKLTFTTLPTSYSGTITYQWYKSSNGVSWSSLAGATYSELQPSSVTALTYFKCVVGDGCSLLPTNFVTVAVYDPLTITSIGNAQTICYNAIPNPLELSGNPSGGSGSFTYQWSASNDGTNFSSINLAVESSYQPAALTASKYYQLKVADASCGSVYSNIIKVSVLPEVTAGSIGGSQTICFNSTATQVYGSTAPTGGNGSFSYQWQYLNGVNWSDISGETGESYQPGTLSQSAYYRRVAVSGLCNSAPSNVVTVTVRPEFKAGSIGSNQIAVFGSTPSPLVSLTSPSGADGSFTFKWLISSDQLTWSEIPGATAESYQPAAITAKTYFKRQVTSAGCGSLESNVVTVDVTGQVTPGEIQGVQTICYNYIPSAITEKTAASGGSGNIIYSWLKSENGTDWTTVIAETGNSLSLTALTHTTYFKRGASNSGSTVYSNIVTVTVMDKVDQPSTDLKAHYCTNSTVTVSVLNPSYTTYKWYNYLNNYLQDGTKLIVNGFNADAKFYVRSVSSNGCMSEPVELNLYTDPVKASFTYDIATVSLGNSVHFTSTSTAASSFVWNFYEGDLIHEENPVHYYNVCNGSSQKFSVSLTVTSSDNCKDSLKKADIITVTNPASGIGDNSNAKLSLYPNPTSGEFRLVCADGIESVYIYNLIGNLMLTVSKSDLEKPINISSFSPGIYFVKGFSSKGGKFNVKIIKE